MARLLIVEDDPDWQTLLAVALRRDGHECTAAASGTEALRSLRGGAEVAGIVVDLEMPGVDGIHVARALAEIARPLNLPVLGMTAFDSSLTAARYGDVTTKILRKDGRIDDFLRAIRELCPR